MPAGSTRLNWGSQLLNCVRKLTIGKGPTLKRVDAQEKLGVSRTMDITHIQLAAL